MKIYPVPGLPLRDPVKGDFIPDEGREVADSPFWRRRLLCNDASLTPPKTTPSSEQAAPLVVVEVAADPEPAPVGDATQDGASSVATAGDDA